MFMSSDLEFDLCNLALDVENHKFYIESLVENDHPRDNPTHVIIKVRVQSDCGVIKYG